MAEQPDEQVGQASNVFCLLVPRCEAHLMHACDADYGDVWQCDLSPDHTDEHGNPTRHHAMGGMSGGGDGFDADCVEVFWHDDDEAERHAST